ncbi:MAG: hypothetical protein EXR76_08865 [Myxococcales bacterium]|nr:hypothetical protein [Myxococcales bacterium]
MRAFVPPILTAAMSLTACLEGYRAPPLVDLEAPETGTYFVGDDLHLSFDGPVSPESLTIRVFADVRDFEGQLPAGTTPLLAACTVSNAPCGETSFRLDPDHLGATITFDSAGLGKPDVPLLLEVGAGLRSESNGARSGRASLFDFQFKPLMASEEDVAFEDGVYIVVGQTTMPVPATLTLITDFVATPHGDIEMVGAEGDELEGQPKNTTDPKQIKVDVSDQGFALFIRAQVRETEAGERFFESAPTLVLLRLGPLSIQIVQTRLTGKVLKDDRGHDRIEGTLSFEDILLDSMNGQPPFPFGPGSTTFEAVYVDPEDVPTGAPRVCGELCGTVTAQCAPPEDFPGEGLCDL